MSERWPVAGSLEELLAGASSHEDLHRADSLSGASFTRVLIDGVPHIVKHLTRSTDWVMRATGDTLFRPLLMWRSGLFSRLPKCLDPVVVGVAYDEDTDTASVLMRDISAWMAPEGGAPFTAQAHAQFLDHMAALHHAFWGWTDDVGLCPPAARWTFLSLRTAEQEAGGDDPVPQALPGGWAAMQAGSPEAGALAVALAHDPTPLTRALARLPQTLVHGDWKGGNLGLLPGGRTALIDWAFPSQDNPLADVAWYVAVNCDRLPESKEDAIARYRTSLEARGIETTSWWDDALALCLLGGFVQMGWSKSGPERDWWAGHALDARDLLA
ncbi:MAG: aminoglycoside phosphotransferase [Frankiales bacterium]|nr:aminoglycoside phosphotransferase [Frankiales bacterium]